jgi:hypothetical protein
MYALLPDKVISCPEASVATLTGLTVVESSVDMASAQWIFLLGSSRPHSLPREKVVRSAGIS